MTSPYLPSCVACRTNDRRLFYIHCGGCQARRSEILRTTPPITKAQVDAMDSTMQPLPVK